MSITNWPLLKKLDREFDQRFLWDSVVTVVVETLGGVQSDDLFETPQTISSGVFSVPCTFEYSIYDMQRYFPGGAITDTTAFILADEKWKSTFVKDGCIVRKDDVDYLVKQTISSVEDGSICVKIERKN